MKKIYLIFCSLILSIILISCSNSQGAKDIQLMGAGDRIHDSYTFANVGVKIEETEKNVYLISGTVDSLQDEKVKEEFNIDEDVKNVVAIKLSANGKIVDKEKVSIIVDGVKSYDAEHLNGSDYTFIILEAIKNKVVSISVSWDGEMENNYIIKFDENITLK